jgi:hypothetical protein
MSAVYGSDVPAKILAIAVATRALFDQQFREKVIRKKLFDPTVEVKPGLLAEQINFDEAYLDLMSSLLEYTSTSQKTYPIDVKLKNNEVHKFVFNYEENQNPVIFVVRDETAQTDVFRSYGPLSLIKAFSLIGFGGRKSEIFPDLNDEQIASLLAPSAPQKQLANKQAQTDQPAKDIKPNTQSPEMGDLYEKFITNTLVWSKDALTIAGPSSENPQLNAEPDEETLSLYRDNAEKIFKDKIGAEIRQEMARYFSSHPYIEEKPSATPMENKPPESQEEDSPSEGTDDSFIEGKYTVADIQKYKDKNDDAKRLYGLLEDFANFIRGSFDWDKALAGATSFAKSLAALGGPSVGGKR